MSYAVCREVLMGGASFTVVTFSLERDGEARLSACLDDAVAVIEGLPEKAWAGELQLHLRAEEIRS